MLGRSVYRLIKTGIEAIEADTSILDELFRDVHALGATEVDAIKKFFVAKGANIAMGYSPIQADDEPQIIILLGNEQQTDFYFDESGGSCSDPNDLDYRMDYQATNWAHSYRLIIVTGHGDITDYYYEIVKSILLGGLPYILEEGGQDLAISGFDLAPDERYLPTHLFARQLELKINAEYKAVKPLSGLQKAFKLAGLYVDKGGAPRHVEYVGVDTEVETFIPDGLGDYDE